MPRELKVKRIWSSRSIPEFEEYESLHIEFTDDYPPTMSDKDIMRDLCTRLELLKLSYVRKLQELQEEQKLRTRIEELQEKIPNLKGQIVELKDSIDLRVEEIVKTQEKLTELENSMETHKSEALTQE